MMNKVKINNYAHGVTMVSILATAGYVVWIEEKQKGALSRDYYVCWRQKESEGNNIKICEKLDL